MTQHTKQSVFICVQLACAFNAAQPSLFRCHVQNQHPFDAISLSFWSACLIRGDTDNPCFVMAAASDL